jgi:D-aminopeptidase
VAEVQALVPDPLGVAMKIGPGREAAQSLAPARMLALIRAGASRLDERAIVLETDDPRAVLR